MANCTVTGSFLDPSGVALSGATVRFNIESPGYDLTQANVLVPMEVTATTAANGSWSLVIAQGTSGTLTLDCPQTSSSSVARYVFSVIVPQSSTATFAQVWVDGISVSTGTVSTGLPPLGDGLIWVGNSAAQATAVSLSGDATLLDTGAMVVGLVGGKSAAAIASSVDATTAATNLNTLSTIVKRDASGNFSAGAITASLTGNVTGNVTGNLTGNVTGNVTGNTSGTAASITGNLTGDVVSTGMATSYSATVPVNKGGTGQTTANAALNALLPTQTSSSGKFLTTDGSNSSWATAGGATLSYCWATDVKAAGTGGGSVASGSFVTRTLNTLVDSGTGVTLSSNQLIIPAGTWHVEGSVPAAFVNEFVAKFRDVTNSADLVLGTMEYSQQSNVATAARSMLRGKFTNASQITAEVQMRVGITAGFTNALGFAGNIGVNNVFTEIKLTKVA